MKADEWFSQQLEQHENDPVFLTERLILAINEKICRLMDEQNVGRAELARRLGVPRQFVTRMLNGTPNVTLLTLVKVATALGAQIEIQLSGKQSGYPLRGAVTRYDDPTKPVALEIGKQ
jgi:plasmid maintenance system antidote protein VapI